MDPLQKIGLRLKSHELWFVIISLMTLGAAVELQARAESQKPVELTEIDVMASKGWSSKSISVYGFTLDLTRPEAFAVARSKKLAVREGGSPRSLAESNKDCSGSYCQVTTADNTYVGIDLYFGTDEHLNKLVVSVPSDAGAAVRRVNVARKFKGDTYRFFNHYSDDLRGQLIGPEEHKQTRSLRSYQYVEYDYTHAGIIVNVTTNSRYSSPFDLSMSFVPPK